MVFAAICLAMSLAIVSAAGANEQPLYQDVKANENKIHIKSDKMVANRGENSAEFRGHVRASRGAMVITCERLKLFFKSDAMADGQPSASNNAIERVTAKEHVKVTMNDRLAFADEAEYWLASGDIKLTGTPVKVTQGNTSFTGHEIVMKSNGEIIGLPDEGGQVEVMVFPGAEPSIE